MVAKAAWLTVEPEISLEGFLASEEIEYSSQELTWIYKNWLADCVISAEDAAVSAGHP